MLSQVLGIGGMNPMTPKKTCEEFGLESVAELAQAVGKPTRTVSHWFNSEPAEILELLKLGIKVRQDAEELARYRAEQLLI